MSLLDTLESIGPNNTELQELERCRTFAVGGWSLDASNNDDEKIAEDDFGAPAERKKAGDWLVGASSTAEETLVSSSFRVVDGIEGSSN